MTDKFYIYRVRYELPLKSFQHADKDGWAEDGIVFTTKREAQIKQLQDSLKVYESRVEKWQRDQYGFVRLIEIVK